MVKCLTVNVYCMTDIDGERDRGILTQSDRRFLAGEIEYEHRQQKWKRKEDINNRVQNAAKDFSVLVRYLDDEKLEDIFTREFEEVIEDGEVTYEEQGTPPHPRHLAAGFNFLSIASIKASRDVQAQELDPQTLQHFGVSSLLSPVLDNIERGLEAMLSQRYDLIADLDVEVTVNELNTKRKYGDVVEEEIRQRDEPLRGEKRIEVIGRLQRAGYSNGEIAAILDENDETPEDE